MVSKRALVYATSLFEISSEETTLKQLEVISDLFKEKTVFDFFNSPFIAFSKKKQIITSSFEKLPPFLKNFLLLVIERRLLLLFSEMKQAFQNLLNEKQNKLQGEIFCAKTLSTEEKQNLKKSLKSFFKKDLELKERKDESSIGGLYIRVGEYVFNDTLSFHLNKFETQGE